MPTYLRRVLELHDNPDGFQHTADARPTPPEVMQAWTAVERIEDAVPVLRGAEPDPVRWP